MLVVEDAVTVVIAGHAETRCNHHVAANGHNQTEFRNTDRLEALAPRAAHRTPALILAGLHVNPHKLVNRVGLRFEVHFDRFTRVQRTDNTGARGVAGTHTQTDRTDAHGGGGSRHFWNVDRGHSRFLQWRTRPPTQAEIGRAHV